MVGYTLGTRGGGTNMSPPLDYVMLHRTALEQVTEAGQMLLSFSPPPYSNVTRNEQHPFLELFEVAFHAITLGPTLSSSGYTLVSRNDRKDSTESARHQSEAI